MGRKRDHNEDSFGLSNADFYGIVCDGMGGHQCGEVASRLGVDVISQHIAENIEQLVPSSECTLGQLRERAEDSVIEWVKDANTQVFQAGTKLKVDGEKRMGSTMVMMMLVGHYAILAHVGDSRIYRYRNRRLERMTEDHIQMVKKGRKANGKIRVKKYVTRALGTHPIVDPEIRVDVVHPHDLFLLCSDGLTDLVKEKEIERVITKAAPDMAIAVRSLIHLANQRGGTDNITVVIGEVWEDDDDDDDDTEDISDIMSRG